MFPNTLSVSFPRGAGNGVEQWRLTILNSECGFLATSIDNGGFAG
jgi:hypothetical protein